MLNSIVNVVTPASKLPETNNNVRGNLTKIGDSQ